MLHDARDVVAVSSSSIYRAQGREIVGGSLAHQPLRQWIQSSPRNLTGAGTSTFFL
ncbi:MAG: hypothetical protein M2R45_01565 [Verrucomicrobia subdivision 3 bacterium]|nr:hypothetical protein [Limisphaerales bacterium]